ncbi:hypothetical protein [Pelagicoccus sp. SDUM812003]|nr:hypothetical protein [Pelagicoccus sp. SDUM812003]MDQ8203587.1 hypothetical protein [Pelagicoccus sp. SDUM812003]
MPKSAFICAFQEVLPETITSYPFRNRVNPCAGTAISPQMINLMPEK